LSLLAIGLLLGACGQESYTPKPRSFPRILWPAEQGYQSFAPASCPFTFELPAYTLLQQDTAFFEEQPVHPCWYDVYFPDFDARIHLTYVPMPNGLADLERLRTDAFEMADWHNRRANYIDELLIERGPVSGVAFDINGPAASPFQFFLTDSTRHFLRGSLYFNTQARADSLAPVIDFVKQDILHLIETFHWDE
jgi:gliding motility-associated lipoprotein GldD